MNVINTYMNIEPFKAENNYYHFVYRTHNLINQKEYTGKHSTPKLNDGYYGSSTEIQDAIEKYGIENFVVEFLSFHISSDEAYNEEEWIVDWEYVSQSDTYNKVPGGKGKIGENTKGRVTVKDKSGNTMSVSVDDPRYLSGELVHINKNRIVTKIACENLSKANSGSKNGFFNKQHTDETKIKIGLQSVKTMTGRIAIHNKKLNKQKFVLKEEVNQYLQLGWELGSNMSKNKGRKMKTSICPHCNKEGSEVNMRRWHFDNCKKKPAIN